ncbi:dipeptidyl peptidase 3 [Elysia marginata]|uniref:Dipeptidyl peptidase 3 n=1 Tax=Elysia marginata TaxID=1093978 RepID=A0AAV4HQT0_9GAST|nr:dipeptidyl peptidase 3 [Elysia marginata]
MMVDPNTSQYIVPINTDVALLDCQEAFNGLTEKEKLYAHHLAQAGFKGGLIVLFQTSPESPGIFVLLQKLFGTQSPEEISTLALSNGFSEDDVKAFLMYAAAFYANMGNYKSFGDTKFVPNVDKVKVERLIKASKAFQDNATLLQSLWDYVKDRMFSLDNGQAELGLGDKGTTTYYSANCTETDANIAQEFMTSKNISPYNTRLFKTKDPNSGVDVYEVRMAAVQSTKSEVPGYTNGSVLGDFDFTPSGQEKVVKFKVTRGDYSPLMSMLVEELENAKEQAANDNERNMLVEYIKSFSTGSLPAHKDGSRFWIKNKGPIVETYIGFIESYRDPYGVRGEFEGV